MTVRTPECTHSGLGSFPFARRYLENRCFFLFLSLLRCFSSGGSLCIPMYSVYSDWGLLSRVSPFRNPRVRRIFASNRGLSQLITSFIGSQCQGIHPALLFALPIRIIIPLALSKIRLQQICCGVPFSLNRTRCLVLLKYLNGYFNIILILILKIFLYEVFKVQLFDNYL